jgi:hypothetical protein
MHIIGTITNRKSISHRSIIELWYSSWVQRGFVVDDSPNYIQATGHSRRVTVWHNGHCEQTNSDPNGASQKVDLNMWTE